MIKKYILLIVLLVLSLGLYAQQRTFVEVVTNYLTIDYNDVIDLCEEMNAIYVINHYHSQDTLQTNYSLLRSQHIGGNYIPKVAVRGYKLDHYLDITEYVNTEMNAGPYLIDSLTVEAVYNQDMFGNATVEVNVEEEIDDKVTLFLIEDIPNHPSTQRIVFQLDQQFIWNTQWNENNCYIVLIVENAYGKVTSAIEYKFLDLFDTSFIPTITMEETFLMYPNPATTDFNIEITQPRDYIKVFSIDGRIVYQNLLFMGTHSINIQKWKRGIYYVTIGKQVEKLIIQ